jgi:hypothetical protein
VLELLGIKKPIDMVIAEAGGAWVSVTSGDAEMTDAMKEKDGLGDALMTLLCSDVLSAFRLELSVRDLDVDDERAMVESLGGKSTLVEDMFVD